MTKNSFLTPIPEDWQAHLARGANKETKIGGWKNIEVDLNTLVESLTTHVVGSKDGRCFLQGKCAGGNRQARAMEELYIIGIDVDNGMPSSEIDRIITERGLFCIRYTTHSHGKNYTEVRQDDFTKYQRKNPDATISDYLIAKKRYLPGVAETAVITNTEMSAGGLTHKVTHTAMDKNRLVFILSKRWVLTELTATGMTQDEAIKEWRRLYLNFAAWLNIPVDESCTDPSRLFYFPRHDMGAVYETVVHQGNAVNLWKIPETVKRTESNPFLDAAKHMGARDEMSATMTYLVKWAAKGYDDRFLIVDALKENVPHIFRPEKDGEGKYHIECAFEEEHTHPGGYGTFVMNAGESQNGSFIIRCQHNSCRTDRDDKLIMLEGMIDNEWLSLNDLVNPDYLLEVDDDEEEEEKEEETQSEDTPVPTVTVKTSISTMSPESAEKKINKLAESDYGEIRIEQELDNISNAVGISKTTIRGIYKKAKARVEKERLDAFKATEQAKEEKSTKKEMSEMNITKDRDVIYVDTDFLMASTKSLRMLEKSNEGSEYIFRFAGGLARVVKDEYGLWKTERMDQKILRHVLSRVTRFLREVGEGNFREISPPLDIVDDILANSSPNFPALYGVVNAPVFGRDGELLTDTGYSHASMLYFAPNENFTLPKVSNRPSVQEVNKAKELLLNNVLVDFPFDGSNDGLAERAHAMCMILQPFVRQMIDGPCPIHLIAKPTPGTGASKLVGVYSLIAHGETAIAQTECRGEEEMRKRITSVLAESRHTFYLDNVNFKVDSSSLASATTADMWTDRLLGTTSTVRVPVRLTWIIAGNNPMLSNELARRCIRIRLDAKVERPEDRKGFKHKDLENWVKDNRGELVWACLTLVQNWISQGRPEADKVKGSFESWSRVIGGILKANDIPGFLMNEEEMRNDADEEGAAIKAFLSMWWTQYGDRPATIGGDGKMDEGLVGLLEDADIPLPVSGNTPRAVSISLGRYVKKIKGRIFKIDDGSNFVSVEITQAQAKDGYNRYCLERI